MTYDLIASHRWMGLWRGEYEEPFIGLPDGGYIHGVMMLPIDNDNNILFVREPQVYTGEPILSLPAGAIDPGEDALTAANRELQEEIGYKSRQLDLLATLQPMARHGKMRASLVLARDLIESKLPNPDAYELVETITRVPFKNFRDLIQQGELFDSNIVSLLYLAEDKLKAT